MIIQNQTLYLAFTMSLLVTACKDDDPGSSNAEDVAEDTVIDSGSEDADVTVDSDSDEIDSELEDIIDTSQTPIEVFITVCEKNWELYCEALYDPECAEESRNLRGEMARTTEVPIITLEDCILFSLEYCPVARDGAAILSGDVLDEESIFTCLSTFEEGDCHERISFINENENTCYNTVLSSCDTGESCFWDQDCINETDRCINEDYWGEFEGGICGSPLSENETCLRSSINDCEEGFTCKHHAGIGYLCTSIVGEGETCGPHSCEDGLFCNNRICIPLGLEGDDCEYASHCDYYLYCYNEVCTAAE